MPVLCIDTATATPVVALLDDDAALVRGGVLDGRAQGLLGLVDEVLTGARDDTATTPQQLTAIVVGIGPGGFTGLRVGVATARGIAETLGAPLHGVDSLLVVAAAEALAHPGEPVWAVLAAGRGEAFAQPFVATASGDVVAVEPMQAVALDQVDALVGEARRVDAPDPDSLAAAARIALHAATPDAGDPLKVLPAYGRAPDAEPPRMQVRIDELHERDLDRLLVLEARCFETPWTRGMYRDELARPARDNVQLAARDEGAGDRLVGAALAARIGDCWHVMNVLVDPAARGRGIGADLVEQLVARTSELGEGEGWTLEVRDGNDAAIRLYERHGFALAGRRPGYYEDTGEDALVMWRYASDAVATR